MTYSALLKYVLMVNGHGQTNIFVLGNFCQKSLEFCNVTLCPKFMLCDQSSSFVPVHSGIVHFASFLQHDHCYHLNTVVHSFPLNPFSLTNKKLEENQVEHSVSKMLHHVASLELSPTLQLVQLGV